MIDLEQGGALQTGGASQKGKNQSMKKRSILSVPLPLMSKGER